MYNNLLIYSTIAVLVIGAPSRPKLEGDEYRAELTAAGLSIKSVEGLVKIGASAIDDFSKYGKTPSFENALEAVTKLISDTEKFMKLQTESDQKAYAAYLEKKKKDNDN
ncbi:Protein CBG22856 [Caenorhabditis briggsae]|uniref:Protein CBG22856 n=2 Tax=Caenorhabditis briggsae TaxID=6238 RepID=A8Y380_CAEBR|nr:Protein CBG22856 [Caenorhabditis briggsae]ULT92098.1 hypothetical protein L3Y34_009663 [Caenorhabditis briggsae]CAP39349.1 Protein CBG22856 [Caenorhabditis briggsae]